MIKLSLNDKAKQPFLNNKLTITFHACTMKFYLINHSIKLTLW